MTGEFILVWWLLVSSPLLGTSAPTNVGLYSSESECKWAGELYKKVKDLKVSEYKCETVMVKQEK